MYKLALLTGGSGGLGSAIKAALLAAGWAVAAPSHAELDVTRPLACEDYADALGRPDAIICAHAAPAGRNMAETMLSDVIGCENVILPFLVDMKERGGRVVLFSSIRAHQPRAGQIEYAASKSAVEGLARGMAAALSKYNVFTNCIAPGAIPTPRTQANIAAGRVSEAELIARTPLGRLITADEVARVALWLASADCPLTGQVITVDGGWSIQG